MATANQGGDVRLWECLICGSRDELVDIVRRRLVGAPTPEQLQSVKNQ